MMAAKAQVFGDAAVRAQILAAKAPGAAEAPGRAVDPSAWRGLNLLRFALVRARAIMRASTRR